MPEQPIDSRSISRRSFLRLGSIGLAAALGLVVPFPIYKTSRLNSKDLSEILQGFRNDLSLQKSLASNQQGRVLDPSVTVYDSPSPEGKQVKKYWHDTVLPLTGLSIGRSFDSFNMVWYKLGTEGYVNSGSIQPVFTIINPVISQIPTGGTLGEVTVPYTDAHQAPGKDEPVAYRFYYATTYWIIGVVSDAVGDQWYLIQDDKWDERYYVLAHHLRIIPAEELRSISPDVPPDQKRIEVHIPEQVMIAFEYDQPVYMARIASGAVFSNGDFSTPIGFHTTFHKRASRHMARGNLAANSYDLPGVPWNTYINEEGVAFHGTYWHNNFGKPRSHGCINLTTQASKWLYLWTKPDVPPNLEEIFEKTGTAVNIIG